MPNGLNHLSEFGPSFTASHLVGASGRSWLLRTDGGAGSVLRIRAKTLGEALETFGNLLASQNERELGRALEAACAACEHIPE